MIESLKKDIELCYTILHNFNYKENAVKNSGQSIIHRKVESNNNIKQIIAYFNGEGATLFSKFAQISQEVRDNLSNLEETEKFEHFIYLKGSILNLNNKILNSRKPQPELAKITKEYNERKIDFSEIYKEKGDQFINGLGLDIESLKNFAHDQNALKEFRTVFTAKSSADLKVNYAKEKLKKKTITEEDYKELESWLIEDTQKKFSTITERYGAEKTKEYTQFEDIGTKVLDAILKNSSISDEEAEQWVEGLKLPTTYKNYPKSFYDIKEVNKYNYRDLLKRFYQLTNGRIRSDLIVNFIRGRAFATNVDQSLGNPEISVNGSIDALFHELAHHVEFDPLASQIANDFLKRRRLSDKLYRLRSLSNKSYRNNEIAYKDHFINPYIGKFYKSGLTEVFSMGIEMLSNPISTAEFLAKDPDMFCTVVGFLTKNNKLSKAYFEAAKENQSFFQEATEEKKLIVDQYIASLSEIHFEDIDKAKEMIATEKPYIKPSKIYGILSSNNGIQGVFFKSSRSYKDKGKQILYMLNGSGGVSCLPSLEKGHEVLVFHKWLTSDSLSYPNQDEIIKKHFESNQ